MHDYSVDSVGKMLPRIYSNTPTYVVRLLFGEMGRRHKKKTEMKREAKTSTTLDCFMAPKRINSEAISYHEHYDCLENTSLAEEGTSVFQERDHEILAC